MCWGVGGGEGRCGERCKELLGGSVGKCVGVWGEVRRDVEKGVGNCVWVWGKMWVRVWGCGGR